jgi:hypothetical protein
VAPDSFHDFFTASAAAAGALIGLLFVAISVTPGKVTGEHAMAEHQVTAGAAFTALVNTLVFALAALLPGTSLSEVAIILGGSGAASTIALGIVLFREHQERIGLAQVLLLVTPLVLYALQLANGIALAGAPRDPGHLSSEGGLSIVFFVYAIARAWQLVGARGASLVPTVAGLAVGHLQHPAARAAGRSDDPAGPAAPPAPPGDPPE